MTIVLQIYPNGEFTHGVDTSHRRDRLAHGKTAPSHELIPVGETVSLRSGDICADIHKDCIHAQPGDKFRNYVEECTYTYLCADMGKHIYAIEYDYGFVTVDTLHTSITRLINKGAVAPIGLSAAPNLKKNSKTRRNTRGLTKRLARRIRNAGHILQEEFSKDTLSFLTLTLPDLSSQDLHKISMNWGAMVHKFLVWLRYRLEKKNIPLRYVYCTEVQTKRLQQRGEYALHLHLLFRGRYGKKSAWAITPLMARKEWVRCIRSVLNHTNFNKSSLENLQRVRANAAGYISKYMSKGSCSLPSIPGGASSEGLSIDWGGMDRNTSQRIKNAILVVRTDVPGGRIARTLVSGMSWLVQEKYVAFYKPGFIHLNPGCSPGCERGIHVGVGRFTIPPDEDTLSFLAQAIMNNCEKDLTDFWSTSYAPKRYPI